MWSCYVIWRCFGGIPSLTQIMRTPVSIVPQVYTAVQSLTPHKVVASGISNHRILLQQNMGNLFSQNLIFLFLLQTLIYISTSMYTSAWLNFECLVMCYTLSLLCVYAVWIEIWGYMYLLDICVKCLMENLKFCWDRTIQFQVNLVVFIWAIFLVS